jgi:hypothetical protein
VLTALNALTFDMRLGQTNESNGVKNVGLIKEELVANKELISMLQRETTEQSRQNQALKEKSDKLKEKNEKLEKSV